jgi:hypothetical protein
MLSGELAVLQALMLDGLSLDPFPLFGDARQPTRLLFMANATDQTTLTYRYVCAGPYSEEV